MSNYRVRTEDEINKMGLLAKGPYAFEVAAASEGPSKNSGKFMFSLDVILFSDSGDRKVKDYITPGTDYGDKKLFKLCQGTGLLPQYSAGTLTADLMVGRQGWAAVGVEEGQPNPKGGNYPDKNRIVMYHSAKPKEPVHTMMNDLKKAPVEPEPVNDPLDEDVPF